MLYLVIAEVVCGHMLLPQQMGVLLIQSSPYQPDMLAILAAAADECTPAVMQRLHEQPPASQHDIEYVPSPAFSAPQVGCVASMLA
jgi:hypothetical protein